MKKSLINLFFYIRKGMDLPIEDIQVKEKNKAKKAEREFEQQLKKKLSNAVSVWP